MSKQRRRHKGRPRGERRRRQPQATDQRLAAAFGEAEHLLAAGGPDAALELLESLLADYPHSGELQSRVGYARLIASDDWGAVAALEQAAELIDDAKAWLDFATVCLKLLLNATALHALHRALKLDPASARLQDFLPVLEDLEREVLSVGDRLGVSGQRAASGLRAMNDGDRALRQQNFVSSIRASRCAAGLLPGYPPPLNNLSLALFYAGQPKQAIETAERVLEGHPDNVHALSNLTRFLAWTGRAEEAQLPWQRLQAISPPHKSLRFPIAQAAAAMADDERVYALLKPLEDTEIDDPRRSVQVQFFLATAEANLGRASDALARLRALDLPGPRMTALTSALEAGRSGLGWSGRYPYYGPTDIMPEAAFWELKEHPFLDPDTPPGRARKTIARFMERFPQLVLVMEQIIWEEGLAQPSTSHLAAIGTPEAHAALRRFGLSQAGTDDERIQALAYLLQAGEMAEGQAIRLWLRGEWREIEPSLVLGVQGPCQDYPPQVTSLLARAEDALEDMRLDTAERLLREVLDLAPEVKEAYNNLAVVCLKRGDFAQATTLLEAALRIDPMYMYARSSLAMLHLREHNVAAAEEIMAPLASGPGFSGSDEAHYRHVLARIALEKEDFGATRVHLNAALGAVPHHDDTLRLLSALDEYDEEEAWYALEMDIQRERWNRRRWLLQTALTTATPTMLEALSVLTKGSLTAIARLTPVRRGWSGLRKPELLEELVFTLSDEDALRRLARFLPDDELDALGEVLVRGGCMAWDEFDALFGNDLDEYPHWEYQSPATTLGRLRCRGLLAEATVDGELLVTIPLEMRPVLQKCIPEPHLGDLDERSRRE